MLLVKMEMLWNMRASCPVKIEPHVVIGQTECIDSHIKACLSPNATEHMVQMINYHLLPNATKPPIS
jgi:hypothetical protein